jgi:hypothetical protein
MAKFIDDHGKIHDLDLLELRKSKESAKDLARIALALAVHTKALLGTLFEKPLVSDRDKALGDLSYAIAAIESIASNA